MSIHETHEPINLSCIPTPALAAELISRPDGRSEYNRKLGSLPRPGARVLKPCPHCLQEFGYRALLVHRPRCPALAQKPE